jgi:fluoride exporter
LTAVLVIVGAVVGAPLRYLTDLLVQSRHDSVFPWGTLSVNAAGSLLLGAVAGAVSGGAPGLAADPAGHRLLRGADHVLHVRA